jgi:hypothetical protein
LLHDSLNTLLCCSVIGFELFGASVSRDIDHDLQALVGVIKHDDRAESGKNAFYSWRSAGRYAMKRIGCFVCQVAKGGAGQRRYICHGREDVGPKPPPRCLQQRFCTFKCGMWSAQLDLSIPGR